MNPRRFLYLGLLIAALTGASCAHASAPEPTAKPTPLPPTDTPAPTATNVPTPATSEGEVPTGFTEDGLPYRGNPDAPVTLSEHSEFQ